MTHPVQGFHHITAMASDPQHNLEFYRDVLGQRLVKQTVNFDDPGTYHLYYGDYQGSPGTILTFFPWPHMKRGTRGSGEVGATAYSISLNSLEYWRQRLAEKQLELTESTRFGETVLGFNDPDGMGLELIAQHHAPDIRPWEESDVPAEHQLRGFHSVTLVVNSASGSEHLLTHHLGLTAQQSMHEGVNQRGAQRKRFELAGGQIVDLLIQPHALPARLGAGSVHHVAFRNQDDSEQAEYLANLRHKGVNVTPVQDRQYFHSIYFREPSGVLFELATDAPGFATDEPLEQLGERLQLPSWYEPQRARIEDHLPKLHLSKLDVSPRTTPSSSLAPSNPLERSL
ncbi:MAG: ring-cleaving dioxygenase [Deinococcota bacterium]